MVIFWCVIIFVAIDGTCYYFCPEEYRGRKMTLIPGSGIYGLIKSKLKRD
jgi:hypothetical protein